jgi:hypothetical protein
MAKEPERQYRKDDGGRNSDYGKVEKQDRGPSPDKEDRSKRDD